MPNSRPSALSRLVLAALVALVLAAVSFAPLAAGEKTNPCEYQGVERIVAIGDVHGAYTRYVEILRLAGIIDDRRRWAGGRANLIQLGDIVDRGADSRKVLDLLQDLEGKARGAGGAVHVLLGNHEVMRMLGDLRYVAPGEYEAFVSGDSIDARRHYLEAPSAEGHGNPESIPLGFVEMRAAFGRNGEYGKWLRRLNTVIRVNNVLFVHGGLSPEVAKQPCGAINETVRRELTTDIDKTRAAPLQSLVASKDGPLWYRGLAQETDDFAPQLDEILKLQGASAIVVGHTVQGQGRIEKRFGGKVIALDTGMQAAYVPNGRASALEIKGGVFTAIYTDRREVLVENGNR